jgi:short-subunit dehydrogenase
MTGETWVILGASSLIARAFAGLAGAAGHALVLAGRDVEELETIAGDLRLRSGQEVTVAACDVLDPESQAAFVESCAERAPFNLFIAVGTMAEQAELDGDLDLTRRLLETNYGGLVLLLQQLAPHLERQGRGRVVTLGSVAGDRGRRKNYLYGSTKAGLQVYLEGLRARLMDAGVTVTTVKPGFVDTPMTWGKTPALLTASPERIAAICWRAAARGRAMVYAPAFWRFIMLVFKFLPDFVLRRLSI